MNVNVQYGCGLSCPDGWINFDASPALRAQRLPVIGRIFRKLPPAFPGAVRYGDIVKGLPVADRSADLVYASHVLEHLAYDDCAAALRNTFRVLKPGGVFRLVVPDLQVRAARYLEKLARGERGANDWLMRASGLGRASRPRTPLEMLRAAIGNSHHQWMWDQAAMTAALQRAGFVAVRRCRLHDSGHPAFRLVEQPDRFHDPGEDLEECAMEARTPLA
ncbi:MAG TPA: methyltransferase domain-containing protein [Pseudolabrys sp.]|nr:methyltransferase domain-containing protein [Pseudolabrys sp.]